MVAEQQGSSTFISSNKRREQQEQPASNGTLEERVYFFFFANDASQKGPHLKLYVNPPGAVDAANECTFFLRVRFLLRAHSVEGKREAILTGPPLRQLKSYGECLKVEDPLRY